MLICVLLLGTPAYGQEELNPSDIYIAPEQFEKLLAPLKNAGIVPRDFKPVYENFGDFGPHSNVHRIKTNHPGPWSSNREGHQQWWHVILHGMNENNDFNGSLHFIFNFRTGEIRDVIYSPNGTVGWSSFHPLVLLLQDIRKATRQSAVSWHDRRIYRSLQESGYLPPGYTQDLQHPRQERPFIPNPSVPMAYVLIPGDTAADWFKVFEYGYIGQHRVEIHYFERRGTGEVTQVEFYSNRFPKDRGNPYKKRVRFSRDGKERVFNIRQDLALPEVLAQAPHVQAFIDGHHEQQRLFIENIRSARSTYRFSDNAFQVEGYDPETYVRCSAESISIPEPSNEPWMLQLEERLRSIREVVQFVFGHIHSETFYSETPIQIRQEMTDLHAELLKLGLVDGSQNLIAAYEQAIQDERELKELFDAETQPHEKQELVDAISAEQRKQTELLTRIEESLKTGVQTRTNGPTTLRIIISGALTDITLLRKMYVAYGKRHNETELSPWNITELSTDRRTGTVELEISGSGVERFFPLEAGHHRLYRTDGGKQFQRVVKVEIRQGSKYWPAKEGFIRTCFEKENRVWDERLPNVDFTYEAFMRGDIGSLHERLVTEEALNRKLAVLKERAHTLRTRLETEASSQTKKKVPPAVEPPKTPKQVSKPESPKSAMVPLQQAAAEAAADTRSTTAPLETPAAKVRPEEPPEPVTARQTRLENPAAPIRPMESPPESIAAPLSLEEEPIVSAPTQEAPTASAPAKKSSELVTFELLEQILDEPDLERAKTLTLQFKKRLENLKLNHQKKKFLEVAQQAFTAPRFSRRMTLRVSQAAWGGAHFGMVWGLKELLEMALDVYRGDEAGLNAWIAGLPVAVIDGMLFSLAGSLATMPFQREAFLFTQKLLFKRIFLESEGRLTQDWKPKIEKWVGKIQEERIGRIRAEWARIHIGLLGGLILMDLLKTGTLDIVKIMNTFLVFTGINSLASVFIEIKPTIGVIGEGKRFEVIFRMGPKIWRMKVATPWGVLATVVEQATILLFAETIEQSWKQYSQVSSREEGLQEKTAKLYRAIFEQRAPVEDIAQYYEKELAPAFDLARQEALYLSDIAIEYQALLQNDPMKVAFTNRQHLLDAIEQENKQLQETQTHGQSQQTGIAPLPSYTQSTLQQKLWALDQGLVHIGTQIEIYEEKLQKFGSRFQEWMEKKLNAPFVKLYLEDPELFQTMKTFAHVESFGLNRTRLDSPSLRPTMEEIVQGTSKYEKIKTVRGTTIPDFYLREISLLEGISESLTQTQCDLNIHAYLQEKISGLYHELDNSIAYHRDPLEFDQDRSLLHLLVTTVQGAPEITSH
ncbi:MAG: brain acid soluble protein 1 [Deltaproteobacteria bacterium]|nr:brain acid soluble protein 1 [Deltaproteobacteria bacterium]